MHHHHRKLAQPANFVIDVALRSFLQNTPLLFMVGIVSEHECYV